MIFFRQSVFFFNLRIDAECVPLSWSSFFPPKNAERLDIFECFIIKLEKTKHAILYDRVKTLNPLLRIAVLSALLGFHTQSKPNRRLTSSFSNVAKVGVNKREVLLGKNL